MSRDNENGKNTLEAIPVEGTLTAEKVTEVIGTDVEPEEAAKPEPLVKTE